MKTAAEFSVLKWRLPNRIRTLRDQTLPDRVEDQLREVVKV